MGEVPRIHRVEPSPAVTGHALRVLGSGDRPGRERKDPERESKDHIELHAQLEEGESPAPADRGTDTAGPPRLDISV